jgi:beta-glucosidase
MSEFLWGAATSSHQIEGHNENNDWALWEARGMVEGGVRSGKATDHLSRFREDIGLAAELGLNSYRFSVEWSRLEPEEGRWSAEAFDWYSELIGECERHRIVPMLTLHHFTSPAWFAAQGGFTSAKAPEYFLKLVEKVVGRFGERVPLWCTLNEPMVLSVGSYLGRLMPPGEFAPEKVALSCRYLLKSHVLAYDYIHAYAGARKGPWKDWPLQVGIAHNMLDFMPERAWHPLERLLAWVLDRFYNQAWLDAVTGRRQRFRIPWLIPDAGQVPEAWGRRTVDFIGVNYYTKAYVQWRPRAPAPERPAELPIGVAFARRTEPVSDLEWAVHPQGLRKILDRVSRYELPVYITENGIADREDRLRPEYLSRHLKEVARAIERGVDLRGYYHWSLLDNFEWIKGFGPRFGLFRVDYETFERSATASARVYQEMIRRHRDRHAAGPRSDLI